MEILDSYPEKTDIFKIQKLFLLYAEQYRLKPNTSEYEVALLAFNGGFTFGELYGK